MILLCSAIAVAVFAYAFWRGDEAIRTAAVAGAAIFGLSLLGQVLVGFGNVWPVVAADLCYGFLLVALAAIHPRRWLYVEIALCALLLLMHGFLLQEDASVTPLYRLLNDGLALSMLAVFAVATFVTDRRRGSAPPPLGSTPPGQRPL